MSNTEELRAAARMARDALTGYPYDDAHWRDFCSPAIKALEAALAQHAASGEPVAWHCPNDPDSATAFFWRRTTNGLCPNCGKKLVPVVLAAAPGAPDAPSESNIQR